MAMRTILLGTLAGLALPVHARAEAFAVVEKPGHISEASVTIDAPPERVYELVTDYAHWPAVLRDVESVTVKSADREHAVVQFRSRVLGHEFTIAFDNQPGRLIHFRGIEGPPGGRADGTYVLEPIDGGAHTRVTASLYMDVVGVTGIFVRDAKVRAMREAKLRADLGDVVRQLNSR